MALSNLYDVDTKNTTTSDVLTYSSATWTTGTSSTIANGRLDQVRVTKGHHHTPVKRDVTIKKDFWDGVEWKEITSYFPRKSITGKIIVGKMHKRSRNPGPRACMTQFAKTKELFEEKLRGNA